MFSCSKYFNIMTYIIIIVIVILLLLLIFQLSTNMAIHVSSMVAARVTKLPHIGKPDVVTTHTNEVHTQIMPTEAAAKPDYVPLWVVVLSACAGAIILMLLIYLLYKVDYSYCLSFKIVRLLLLTKFLDCCQGVEDSLLAGL